MLETNEIYHTDVQNAVQMEFIIGMYLSYDVLYAVQLDCGLWKAGTHLFCSLLDVQPCTRSWLGYMFSKFFV